MKREKDLANLQSTTTQRYEFLDGLRGIAALIVVFFHFNNLLKDYSIHAFPHFIDQILSHGHCGVEIFFILSGFVITYSIRNQPISSHFFGIFFIKRSIRLDPPYWLALCFLIGLSFIGNLFKNVPGPLPSYFEILSNFFYLSDFLEVPRILPVSWTLFLELQFYLFLVLLVKCLQFFNTRFSSDGSIFSMTLPSLLILYSLTLFSLTQNTSFNLFPFIPGLFIYHWYSFFIGCLACWTMLNTIKPIFFWINWSMIGLFAYFANPNAYETCLISALIYCVSIKGKMHDYLTSYLFQYLGKISYSLYLVHWIVGLKIIDLSIRYFKEYLEFPGAVFLLFTFALIMTFLMSHIFYHLIELPCLNFSKKIKDLRMKSPLINA